MEISIEGVNVEKGLSSARGRAKIFIRFLETFYKEGNEKYTDIEASFTNRDIPLYTTYVHGLKSASQIIGAEEFSKQAEMLEAAGNSNDWDYISTHNATFLQALKALLENIGKALADI